MTQHTDKNCCPMNDFAECRFCRSPLKKGAEQCPLCHQFQDWTAHCPLCRHRIHPRAIFCTQCNQDIKPEKKKRWFRQFNEISVPVATITAIVALMASILGLTQTIEKIFLPPSPAITITSGKAEQNRLKLTFFNANDQIAFIESVSLVADIYEDNEQQVMHTTPAFPLSVENAGSAFLDKGANEVALVTLTDTTWEDQQLNAMSDSARLTFLEHPLRCDLSLVLRDASRVGHDDTEAVSIIPPQAYVLRNDQCREFLLFRFKS